MDDTRLLLIAGGVAAVGGYLYWRSRQPVLVGYDGTIPLYLDPSSPVAMPVYRAGNPVSGPIQAPARATLADTGPSASQTFTKLGTGAGTAIGTAAVGPGLVATAAITAGIGAGVAALIWGITSKGLFRGGEVGVLVNPARDQFLLQFGPGGTGPDSGFGRLAAALTEITGEPDGSHYFKALIGATSKEQLIVATQEIQRVLAGVGVQIVAYEG